MQRIGFQERDALPMKLADGIRKHGFRKWYERELLQSHAHLVLLILCSIGLLAAFEAAWRFRGWQDQALDLLAGVICAATGLWALRRYLALLSYAEMVANQADCPKCQTYGRMALLPDRPDGAPLRVRCRHCAHEWDIET